MLTIQRILCPVDFSERSRAAAKHAAALAERFDGEVLLMHVADLPEQGPLPFSEKEGEKRQKTQVETAHHQHARLVGWRNELGPDRVTPILAQGDAVEQIEAIAKDREADLVVIATHGWGRFRRFLLGSLTAKLLHDLPQPILTGAHLEDDPPFSEAPYRKIGCALGLRDLEHTDKVLRWAGDLAEAAEAQLTAIHVVDSMDLYAGEWFPTETLAVIQRQACETISELLARQGRTADVKIQSGDPLEEVTRAIDAYGCDALVIGRSIQRGIFRIGHTDGYSLIRNSPVPVFSI